ncbi:hypothetical protein FOZ62_019608 [Perkinsus olseni]|uniref:Reverse transcriptase domain-containing protein n=1 Tax=Perkinsus olseni TaxID=32597 RepID=A0A7J6PX46_PEROL|nr:hypothetical protein FOZ62_019608 [Perkinsus olseni]
MLGDSPKYISRTDMANAYRQLLIDPADAPFAAGIFLSSTQAPLVVLPKVLPFGACGSVTAFLRASELHCHLARSLFFMNLFSYLDDFFPVESTVMSDSAFRCLAFLMEFCTGARIKHAKDIPPAPDNLLLGLMVHLGDGGLKVSLPPDKCSSLITELLAVRDDPSTLTSKLTGKLSFACEAFLGRAGRGFVRSLIRSSLGLTVSPNALSESITALLYVLRHPQLFHRDLTSELKPSNARLICYSDATGDGSLGIFMVGRPPEAPAYGLLNISSLANSNHLHINLLELVAAACAVHSFSVLASLDAASLILFLDNSVAESLIYCGSSASPTLNAFASRFWLECAKLPLNCIFIGRPVILGKHPIPGYLVADLPRSGLLSDFLDRDWPDFIPAAWRRIKRIDKNQPSSLSSVSAILMAGLGLTSRLALANLIGPTVCMAFQARLTDAAFGRDGTSRARNAFEGALTELHSCVLEGRCPDIALAIPSSTCSHELEKILSKFRGFMPPPPAMPPAASTKGAKGKGGKGTFLIRSSNPLPPQDPPPAEAPQQPPVKSQDSSPPRRDSRSYY